MRDKGIPQWMERALQGLAFWIGHRHALYRDHPITEGALVTEACNLIQANLEKSKKLICECSYSKLVKPGESLSGVSKGARTDLVVVQRLEGKVIKRNSNIAAITQEVIEVKRASSSKANISKDIQRLSALKKQNPNIRAFLFLISEAKLPKEFVSEKGSALKKKKDTSAARGTSNYAVRRVCKASASFKKQEHAHYACVLEIL